MKIFFQLHPFLATPLFGCVNLVLLLCVVAAVVPMQCQSTELPVIQATREIGVSFSPSLIAYREYVDGTVQDSEHGWIPGVGAKASFIFDALKVKNLWLSLNYDYNTGSSNHRSKSLTNDSILVYPAPFRSNDISIGIGKGFLLNSKLLLAPYIGFEYREWHRDLPHALLSIREDYTFWAPGAGLSASYNPVHILVLKAKVGAAYTISPMMAGIGNPAGQVPNLTFALGNRPVWQANGGADGAITCNVHAFVGIAYSHFGFGKSASIPYGNGHSEFEPSSVTDLAKVHVGIAWSF